MALFEFTSAYLSSFNWALPAYQYMLGLTTTNTIPITQDTLTAPSLTNLPSNLNIATDADWNSASLNQVAVIGAMYNAIDTAEGYYNSLYTVLDSRLSESEQRIQLLQSQLKVLLAGANVASTSVSIQGGDTTSVETSDIYYRSFPPLQAVPDESIFRLQDTGYFSSIRSLGGFAGNAVIEFSLGTLVESGTLPYVVDGSTSTFWQGTFYCPAPMRSATADISWLPQEYQQGYACMLTYYMDMPTLATEVYIDPVTTEPMDIVSISWTPFNITTAIVNGDFSASGSWSFYGSSTWLASSFGLGTASGAVLEVTSSSGYASQTFSVSGSYLTEGASSIVSPGSRCEIYYNMRAYGDLLSGIRIVWLDASGQVISYKVKEDYPASFFVNYRLVDYIPTGAVSGRIDAGIFTPCTGASAYIDNVIIYLGETVFPCQQVIDSPMTISLPSIARSGRFSFVLAQGNPRRAILATEGSNVPIPTITGNLYLDPTLQQATANAAANLANVGPGTSIFAYVVGMRELDLRYREHVPRGSLVSLPLITSQEIRQIWITSEIGPFYNDNSNYFIYPFANNTQQMLSILPFGIGAVDSASTTLLSQGQILKIYTFEEQDAGYVNPQDTTFVTAPQTITDTFNGTTIDAKVNLTYAPHLRGVFLQSINSWIASYGIWDTPFDPNCSTIYGLPSGLQNIVADIRNGVASGFELDDLISTQGYLPIQVTVETDQWTAVPDIYGSSSLTKVRSVLLEDLTPSTLVQTSVNTTSDYQSQSAWMNSTSLGAFMALVFGANWIGTVSGLINNTFFGYINQSNLSNVSNITLTQAYNSLVAQHPGSQSTYNNYLLTQYNSLKAQGNIPLNSSATSTTTSATEVDNVYSTQFSPIITGPSGAFISLFWFDPINILYSTMSRSDYVILDPTVGQIQVIGVPPASSYTAVLANYKYINYSGTEDYFGDVISFANPSSAVANVTISSRPFPITRNMTDYESGVTPTLTPPDFNRLDSSYYPVIEYYLNSNGEIIFSRDFFEYGDIPAKITVVYQTLAIQPRMSIQCTRSGSPSATPTICNMSLRVRENSPVPTMSNT